MAAEYDPVCFSLHLEPRNQHLFTFFIVNVHKIWSKFALDAEGNLCLISCKAVSDAAFCQHTLSLPHYSSPLHESLHVDFEENDIAESKIVSVCQPYEELFTLNLVNILLAF